MSGTASRAPVDPALLRRSRPVRRQLVLSVALGLAGAGAVVTQAWLLTQVIVSGFDGGGVAAVTTELLALAGVFAVRAGLGWAHEVTATRAAAAVKAELRRDVMAALLSDRPARTDLATGRLIALVGAGLDALDGYLARYLPQLVLAVVVPLVIGAVVLATDLTSAIVLLVTLPLIPVFMVLIGLLTQDRVARRWSAVQRLSHHFTDLLGGLTTLKVLGRARAQVTGLRSVGERHRTASMAALRWAFLSALVLELIATLSVALVAVGVGLRLVQGDLGFAPALFVLLLAPEAYLPLRQVGTHFHDSADGVAAARAALAVVEAAAAPAMTQSAALTSRRPATVELSGVGVRYPGRPVPALDGLSLELRPGEVVALAGPSGCGKSTACAVLLGLVEPDAGELLVDGRAVTDLASWRAQLAWVPQRPVLVAGTVADNVRLGVPAADDAAVRRALETAVADLEPGRWVGERGSGLSAGEQRRVSLARALLRVQAGDAWLLVLDEPTAGLDSRTEALVVEQLRDLGATILLVAHRPALVVAADRVVELAGGHVRQAVPS